VEKSKAEKNNCLNETNNLLTMITAKTQPKMVYVNQARTREIMTERWVYEAQVKLEEL
jgi:hypothetical protein